MAYNAQRGGMWVFVVIAISFRHMSRYIILTIDAAPCSLPPPGQTSVSFAIHLVVLSVNWIAFNFILVHVIDYILLRHVFYAIWHFISIA